MCLFEIQTFNIILQSHQSMTMFKGQNTIKMSTCQTLTFNCSDPVKKVSVMFEPEGNQKFFGQ